MCGKFFPNEKELTRKIVHIGTGPLIPIAYTLNIPKNLALIVAGIVTTALAINYRLKFFQSIENVDRKSFGTISYAISITFLIFLFWSNNPSALISGTLVMAFGDGFAGLIGRKINSPKWIICGQTKSVIGTLSMCLITAIIISSTCYFTDLNITFLEILITTAIATFLEQIGPLGIDNISVPIGVAICMNVLIS